MEEISIMQMLTDELCFLLEKRNKINHLRSKARWKRSYWKNALKVVRAFTKTNLAYLKHKRIYAMTNDKGRLEAMQKEEREMECVKVNYPYSEPKNWIKLGSMKIRENILKAEADYASAKHQTMVFTRDSQERLSYLREATGCRIFYRDGYVTELRFSWYVSLNNRIISKKEITKRAETHELNLAITDMVES